MPRHLLALILLVTLAACADDAPAPAKPLTLDYARLGKISLAVTTLDFMNNAPAMPPKDEAAFRNYQPQLRDALYRWAADRLQASGTQGHATLTVQNAELSRERLHLQTAMSSWFTRQQAERWTAKVVLALSVTDGPGHFSGNAGATVTRSLTLPEDTTPAERENAYRRLLLSVMDDLNAEMDRAIRQHLNPVMLTAP